ncbi:MAG TPA: GNAT family N-acetyltransferase [Nitrososphaera sp.]|nr:GNAT family N-acetyltransferase [Nitrososphaera sp.]
MRNLRIQETAEPEQLKNFLLTLTNDTLYTFNHFGDIRRSNVNAIVQKELARKDKIKFFAFMDSEMVAYSFLTLFDKPEKGHNCILGIVVGDSWQDKGLGKTICGHMIKKAWKAGLEKIWLNVHSDNPRAIHLYKSLGFEIEGVFMADEVIKGNERHIISMAIFKNRRFGKKERLNIWDSIED